MKTQLVKNIEKLAKEIIKKSSVFTKRIKKGYYETKPIMLEKEHKAMRVRDEKMYNLVSDLSSDEWKQITAPEFYYLEIQEHDFEAEKKANDKLKSIKNQSDMGLGRTTPKKKAATPKRKTAAKKTIRKHEGINQRTGKLKKGYKYAGNGRIEKVKTPTQKVRQTGRTNRVDDLQRQAKKPGKRTSATGKTYYERRANRSDKGKLLAPNGGSPSDLCYRKNPDGSTTIYGSRGGDRPCPYGGRVGVKTVSALQPQPVVSLSGARKKKPTAKQLAARAKFAANVRAGKYRK